MVLAVEGVLDGRGAALLEEVLRAALDAVGHAWLIRVDLRAASHVGGLPRALRQLQRAGGTVRLPTPRPRPRSVLASVGGPG